MFNFCDIFLLGLFYVFLAKFISTLNDYSSSLDETYLNTESKIKLINPIDDNDKVSLNVKNFFEYNQLQHKDILLIFDGNLESMILFNILKKMYKFNLYLIHFVKKDSKLAKYRLNILESFCLENNIILFTQVINNYQEMNDKILWMNEQKFVLINGETKEYTCYDILDSLFDQSLNNYNPHYKYITKNNLSVKIYNPLYNISIKELQKLSYEYEIEYFQNNNQNIFKKDRFLNTLVKDLNNFYPNWYENIFNIHETNKGFSELLEMKLDEYDSILSKTELFKNGFLLKVPLNQISYNYWKENLIKYFNKYNFSINEEIINIYLKLHSDNNFSGKFNEDIYYFYSNYTLLVYNNSLIQKYLDQATLLINSSLDDTKIKTINIDNLLNENINMYKCDDSFIPQNININTEILNNLKFKKFENTHNSEFFIKL